MVPCRPHLILWRHQPVEQPRGIEATDGEWWMPSKTPTPT